MNKRFIMSYDYNTQRKRMNLPEYGRNVQKMVDHLKTIEDRTERNRAARTIIQIMGNLNPHLRDEGDFKHKLWDHLALIADFERRSL
jgi:CRISPR/Cas system-associated endonuclease Cas1